MKEPRIIPPYSSQALLEAYMAGDIPMARETEHYAYSEVFFCEVAPTPVFLLSSVEPIDFGQMPGYFGRIDDIDAAADEAGVTPPDGVTPMWLYHNAADQPLDPGGNPVRSPFRFEIGFEIESGHGAFRQESPEGGAFKVDALPAMAVASVIYRGSFPHQENSGFDEAWMTLVPAAEAAGLRCAYTLYREIYHLMDWEDPAGSISEILVRLVSLDRG